MKQIISLAIAIIFAIGANAQTSQSATVGAAPATGAVVAQSPCTATLQDGKVWVMESGKSVAMTKSMSFPNGIILDPSGQYTSKDAKTKGQLLNGQCFDAKGNVARVTPPAAVKDPVNIQAVPAK